MDSCTSQRDALVELIASFGSCGIAYSGGVDSAVVAKAAHVALGDAAVAITGISPSLARSELATATEVARLIGIRHELLETHEFSRPEYIRNEGDRCFHCKTELYGLLRQAATQFSFTTILNGVNTDDLQDHRPGLVAATNFSVRSPLVECGISKPQVRALARSWDLPVWDKPASPCLSSRLAYGEAVTPERLAMVEAAEAWLRQRGLVEVRVRYHRGDVARIEVLTPQLATLLEPATRESLVQTLRGLGFKFISLDLEGLRSGSLNQLVQLEQAE